MVKLIICLLQIGNSILVLDRRLNTHIQSHTKDKEPATLNLVRQYNNICQEMNQLIKDNKAPKGALSPRLMDREGLFSLDVDDEIWQDIGLSNEEFELAEEEQSGWLVDDRIRGGIKYLLQLDRCMEEETRLQFERCTMQEWMLEEWRCVKAQMEMCSKSTMCHLNLIIHTINLANEDIGYQLN